MPGLYPNPSGGAESFRPGDQVKWYVNENEISPYIGRVTEVCPSTQKVWVDFPVGGNQQKDPTELILVTKYMGKSPVKENSGYDSYEKAVSRSDYGTMNHNLRNLAESSTAGIAKMASGIAKRYATEVVEKLSNDVADCIEKGMTDIQAYQNIYPKYESRCSDPFIRSAIKNIYASVNF